MESCFYICGIQGRGFNETEKKNVLHLNNSLKKLDGNLYGQMIGHLKKREAKWSCKNMIIGIGATFLFNPMYLLLSNYIILHLLFLACQK